MRLFIIVFSLFFLSGSMLCAQEPGLKILSPAFENNADIPDKYTCLGGDINPPLEWSNVPAKAKSLALSVTDPDAPTGTWAHWVLINIPPQKTAVGENAKVGTQLLNDFGKFNYGGPCPPDEKEHHYQFQLFALDIILDLNEGMTLKELDKAMRGHILAQDKLTGLFRKPIWNKK